MVTKTIGKFVYAKSNRKGKKLMTVAPNGKTLHFGAADMEHFRDKTGLLPKSLNHNDEERRESYLARTSKIKDGSGKLTKNNPNSANYHARRVLWNA